MQKKEGIKRGEGGERQETRGGEEGGERREKGRKKGKVEGMKKGDTGGKDWEKKEKGGNKGRKKGEKKGGGGGVREGGMKGKRCPLARIAIIDSLGSETGRLRLLGLQELTFQSQLLQSLGVKSQSLGFRAIRAIRAIRAHKKSNIGL